MNTAIHTAEETITTNIESQKSEFGIGQICFGATMAVAALYGMWGLVSFMFSYFVS